MKYFLPLICSVAIVLFSVACTIVILNTCCIRNLGAKEAVFDILSIKNNLRRTINNLLPNHFRYLFPQIWSCQSGNFRSTPGYYSQFREDEALHRWIFNNTQENRNPGIFVEIGALDGLSGSNTLFFERMYDWRGVLIEAQPDNAKKLMSSNRIKAVKLPIGICSLPQTHIRMVVSILI